MWFTIWLYGSKEPTILNPRVLFERVQHHLGQGRCQFHLNPTFGSISCIWNPKSELKMRNDHVTLAGLHRENVFYNRTPKLEWNEKYNICA